mmetsp:Transcript_11719/g.21089  ORF Transcript_11719/g.21089 Transcript_11719/m.21089 type:complete len:111 (+) Transcript_11719:1046-1378(+)
MVVLIVSPRDPFSMIPFEQYLSMVQELCFWCRHTAYYLATCSVTAVKTAIVVVDRQRTIVDDLLCQFRPSVRQPFFCAVRPSTVSNPKISTVRQPSVRPSIFSDNLEEAS